MTNFMGHVLHTGTPRYNAGSQFSLTKLPACNEPPVLHTGTPWYIAWSLVSLTKYPALSEPPASLTGSLQGKRYLRDPPTSSGRVLQDVSEVEALSVGWLLVVLTVSPSLSRPHDVSSWHALLGSNFSSQIIGRRACTTQDGLASTGREDTVAKSEARRFCFLSSEWGPGEVVKVA